MSLPKLSVPTYTTTVPSTGQEIKFRPFLVKEQKILLMAMESQDVEEITQAIRDILKECIQDELEFEKLPSFDLEYLFLKLRARSIGETVDVAFIMEECPNEPKCRREVQIDLDSLEVTFPEFDNRIKLTDDIGITMNYPTTELMEKIIVSRDDKSIDAILKIIALCVKEIYDTENVYPASQTPQEELLEFLETLNKEQLEKIGNFFNNMPHIKHDITVTCEECGKTANHTLRGLVDFFG